MEQIERHIEQQLNTIAQRQKIGLWRTHPAFFWLVLYFIIDSFVVSGVLLADPVQSAIYENLFVYMPQPVYALLFFSGGVVFLAGLLLRQHALIRVGAAINLVPNMMMITNFVLLLAGDGSPSLIIASFKWGLACLALLLMLKEPFVNPLSAR